MKRIIALMFVVAVLVSAAFAPAAGADPGTSMGGGKGQLGPGNGKPTEGSCSNNGLSLGADFKCLMI
jgi:hypothetical protein